MCGAASSSLGAPEPCPKSKHLLFYLSLAAPHAPRAHNTLARLQGEHHANNQTMAKLLHKAVGLGDKSKPNPEAYAAYQVRTACGGAVGAGGGRRRLRQDVKASFAPSHHT